MGDCLNLGTDDITVLTFLRYSAASQPNEWMGTHIGAIVGKGYLDSAGRGYGLLIGTGNEIYWQIRNQASEFSVPSDVALNDGQWHLVIGVCDRHDPTGVRLYVDGVRQIITADATALNGIELSGSRAFAIGSRQEEDSGTWYWDLLGSVAMVCVWKRVLTDAEIRELRLNPFGMFTCRHIMSMPSLVLGRVVQCTGSIQTTAFTSSMTRITRGVAGVTGTSASISAAVSVLGLVSLSANVHGCAALHAILSATAPHAVFSAMLQTRMTWQREALFSGTTQTALALGTALTQGWFWMRRNGCAVVHRGPDMTRVDLSRILYATELKAQEIHLPAYLSYSAGTTYYLIRRFNGCGHEEKTTAAAAVIDISPEGQVALPRPNAIVGEVSEETDADTVRLTWFYCPLDQKARPTRFKLYQGDPAGEASLETPITTVPYNGRQFYRSSIVGLAAGTHIFVVRAASIDGIENLHSGGLVHRISASLPEPAVILIAESA